MERFSPKVWTLGLKIGAIYVQRGINNFDDWSAKMAESCGTKIEPWLSAIWETLCNIPEGSKFNDKQILALADRIGGLYSHGTTKLYGIAKAIEGDIGAENTAKLFPMIQATYRGIKRYFDDLKRKAPPAVKTKTIASGVCGENLTWILDDNGTLTISGTGEMEDYVYVKVNANYSYANTPWHYSCEEIEKVIICYGVISIGKGAFQDCYNLKSIVIPDSVASIGNYAFTGCENLTKVKIPNSITSIGENVFNWCESLTEIKIPDGVTSIDRSAFSHCNSLTIVKIPETVTSIGEFAFFECKNLTKIIISDSVTSIGKAAFACTSLKKIKIPAGVTLIGEQVFSFCKSIQNIYYPAGRGFEKNLSQDNNAKLIPYDVAPSAIEAGTRGTCGENLTWTLDDDGTLTISGTGEMENYVYDSDNDSINSPWWDYREAIKRIIIYDGVTSIGNWAFDGCKSLKNLGSVDNLF